MKSRTKEEKKLSGSKLYRTQVSKVTAEDVDFSNEEKENYMKLMFPEKDTSEFYKQEENRELFWSVIRNLEEMDYSIYDAVGEYCGNLELKKCRVLELKKTLGR